MALVLVLVVSAVVLVSRPRGEVGRTRPVPSAPAGQIAPRVDPASPGGGTANSQPSPSGGAGSVQASPAEHMPHAWLAWISGGFLPGFRRDARTLPKLDRTVVVAGDTVWMSASHDDDGRLVDDPVDPYAIPLDAFAVNASEYGPFLPESARRTVVDALAAGKAVLGASSATLRRLGEGGTLTFGTHTIEVGAVVPDDLVGWSEILVSRPIGAELGIAHERYLLALTGKSFTERSFSALIASTLPARTPIRVDAPGTTPYARVASGVRPVIVMKQVFGEFSAYPRSDDPAYLNMNPAWVKEHIATRTVPLLGEVTCNVVLFPQLVGALTEMKDRGLGDLVHVYSGCYVGRTVARSTTAPPSYHSYGAAIDINAPENPYGVPPINMDQRMVEVLERWGFNWGGDFLIPDGHHFEYWGPPEGP
jgi:D-alanyl-D-alanine carboxypeptidase